MAADRVVYCLEQLTDYHQFERLCHDMMALDGYENIEPLGGSQDKGRDALHRDRNGDGKDTVFAYSVREDWRKKLGEDAEKVHKHGHACKRLAFLCTAQFTATERDEAVAFIRDKFGWDLELYGLERLRIMLTTTHKEVVAHHPSIFCQPFFPAAGGLSLAPCQDHLILDHADADSTLAQWLARRLTVAGFRVWCRNLAPLAGTSAAESIKALIRTRAFRYLPVLSASSLACPEMATRRALAHATGDSQTVKLVLPVYAAQVDVQKLEQETRCLEAAHFESSWAEGLGQLLAALDAAQCPRFPAAKVDFVLQSFLPANVLVNREETLAANTFPVLIVPEFLRRFVCDGWLSDDELMEARLGWSFRKVSGSHFISFCHPSTAMKTQLGLKADGTARWGKGVAMDDINTLDIVKELLRRSMDVACGARGLQFCKDGDFRFFPHGMFTRELLRLVTLEGKNKHVGIAGERTFGAGMRKAKYRYNLAPTFSVIWRTDHYEVIVRPRIRISDLQGNPMPARAALARRKDIGGTWWNDDWLNRIIGTLQFLSNKDGRIQVGTSNTLVVVDSNPVIRAVPVGINEMALKNAKTDRDEIAKRDDDDEEEEAANDGSGS